MKVGLNKEIIKYINNVDKSKLDKFFVDILDLKRNVSSDSLFPFVQQFNKFLIRKKSINKEDQINFCLFFSYLIKDLVETKPSLEIVDKQVYLKGNKRKRSLITNISNKSKKDQGSEVNSRNLYLFGIKKEIQTSSLNRQKFDTMEFFAHMLENNRYEFKLTKATVKNLLYIFYICQTRTTDKTGKQIDNNISEFFNKIINFLEIFYKTLKT